jgi:hypothetical protein
MKVIAHQHIGVNGDIKLVGVFAQQIQQRLVICLGGKDRLPVIATLNHVVGVPRQRETGKTSQTIWGLW